MFRKKIVSILTALAMFSFILTTGLNNVSAIETSPSYSAKEVFQGIIAGQGDAASEFKSLWSKKNLARANEEENVKLINDVIEKMDKKKPDFFENLDVALKNKDFKSVDLLLTEGSEEFLLILNKEHSAEIADNIVDANCLVLALSMAVVLSHAAAVTFYLYTVAAGSGLDPKSANTSRESMVVDMIEVYNN
ncbi:hypothetical protein SporoP8_10940 [Sporosarcina ureae]|uniref:hypothetical protein n=1 Tax=Sporosarcina ureae TaxID=1571 RepID=UPI000A16A3EC|nr:hypothetical protein [Sporosarcina ureae]ARJ39343.1 hypothetical protein SporoP8_10940 [Sporosarcina ureae]